MDGYQWFGVISAVVVFLWGIYKWGVSRNDIQRTAINDAQDRKIEEHGERLTMHGERLDKLDDLIAATREEVQLNYPRLEQIEKIETSIKDEIKQVHIRLGGLARELNQTIGALNQRHDNEITNLVKQIKDALEHKGE